MMKGRNDEARATLARLHAHGDENDVFVRSEYADIHDSVEKEKLETRDAWVQIFSNKANFRRVVSWHVHTQRVSTKDSPHSFGPR